MGQIYSRSMGRLYTTCATFRPYLELKRLGAMLIFLVIVKAGIPWNWQSTFALFTPNITSINTQVFASGLSSTDLASKLPRPHVEEVSCSAMFAGDNKTLTEALTLMSSYNRSHRMLSQQKVKNASLDCPKFIAHRQYIMNTMSPEEADFPIAFSLVVYYDAGLVERLLRALYRPQNYYCLHVDSRSNHLFYEAVQALTSCFNNVFVATERTAVRWGYFGVLEADIICLRELLRHKKWRYLINLTGEEFPLKTNKQIVEILKEMNGANAISNAPINKLGSTRWKYVYALGKEPQKLRKEPPPFNLTIHKSDCHVILSRDFATFILTDHKVLKFLDWVKDTRFPEEIFYATIQYNPQLRVPGTFNGSGPMMETGTVFSRYKHWNNENYTCHGYWRRSLCMYGVGDLNKLIQDNTAFYVNKILPDSQPLTGDCMEELYYNRTYDDYTGRAKKQDLQFYRNIFYVKNHYPVSSVQ